jgi:hypothetical protein
MENTKKTVSSRSIVTATTVAKEMTKTEVKENNMYAIKATIEEYVRPLAETGSEFVDCVNKITHDEAGFTTPIVTPDFLIKNNVHLLCDKVINSRMSADDKLSILRLLEGLIFYVGDSGRIAGYSICGKLWEDAIRYDADCRIAEHNVNINN